MCNLLLLSGVHVRHSLVACLVGGLERLAVDDLLLVLDERARHAAEGAAAVAQDVAADIVHSADVGAAEEREAVGEKALAKKKKKKFYNKFRGSGGFWGL
jgi:hypothetical protein